MNQATEPHEELLHIADNLEQLAERGQEAKIKEPLERLQQAANEIGKAWGGSWLGYHANVYYEGLKPPPPGTHFSQEWGLGDNSYNAFGGSEGWAEFKAEDITATIYELANNPNLEPACKYNDEATNEFDTQKSTSLSIIETELPNSNENFLQRLKDEIEKLSVKTEAKITRALRPTGNVISSDYIALNQGFRTPPHFSVISQVLAVQRTISAVASLAKITRQAGSHLLRQRRQRRHAEIVGTNVFIGHGRSLIWRELKDFIKDRLGLPVDEFNRIPVAGFTNIARLSEMMDAAAIAFLVMTGEDEQPDGNLRPRMNVIHEAGLFQGRLGFDRAIVLLEEECQEFSNIAGLVQIRFAKGNIKSAFEEIRVVLEREGILTSHQPEK